MPHTTTAVRGFYAAFYQWAVSTSRSTAQHRLYPRTPCLSASALHTTARRCEGDGSIVRKHARRRGSGSDRPRMTATPDTQISIPSMFTESQVETADERPFHAFGPNDLAIRYRSDAGLMIEAAVPDTVLHVLEERYSPRLKVIAERTGARIEVQKGRTTNVENKRLVSVMISGTFKEVARTWDHISVQLGNPLHKGNVEDELRRPSDSLAPMECVVRERALDKLSFEISVPEERWQRFAGVQKNMDTLLSKGARINIREPSKRPAVGVSKSTALARSIFVTGNPLSVIRVHDLFMQINRAGLSGSAKVQHGNTASALKSTRAATRPSTPKFGSSGAGDRAATHSQLQNGTQVRQVRVNSDYAATLIGRVTGMSSSSDPIKHISKQTNCTIQLSRECPGQPVFKLKGSAKQLDEAHELLVKRITAACTLFNIPEPQITVLEPEITPVEQSTPEIKPELYKPPVASPELGESVRSALRHLAHPVVIITSRLPVNEPQAPAELHKQSYRAVTVSSFNTVTLQPRPVISFNLKVPSRTWDAIETSERLRVHLVAASPRGAAAADVFARSHAQPSEGFDYVSRLGMLPWVKSARSTANLKARLSSDDRSTILWQMHARLLPKQCVRIVDHVIVVAEVMSCQPCQSDRVLGGHQSYGLAYLDRSYRAAGEIIQPEVILDETTESLPIDLPDPLTVGDAADYETHVAYRGKETTDAKASSDNQTSSAEELYAELEQGYSDDDVIENDAPHSQSSHAAGTPLWGPEDVTREESMRLAENAAPRAHPAQTIASATPGAKGLTSSQNRPYSTFSRPALGLRRSFSTQPPMASSEASNIADLVEPSARKTTVADFFGVPDDRRAHSPRVRSLFAANKTAQWAKRRLEEDEAILTEEQKLELQHKYTVNYRQVAKKLAWNAAGDLRVMLDKGRVDFRRARFMESAIERGQAVVIEEAKQVREMLENGRIGREEFERIKDKLEETSNVLTTEAMRLRQIVDEEGDLMYNQAEQESSEGFDGFAGNR